MVEERGRVVVAAAREEQSRGWIKREREKHMAEKDRDEDGAKGGLEGDGGVERESGNGKGKRKKAESRILGGRENRFRKKEKIQNEFLHQRAVSILLDSQRLPLQKSIISGK